MVNDERDSHGMPQAGFIIEHQNSDLKWKILRNIYSGPFSDVYVIADVKTETKYAMKCERQEGNARPVLKLDVMVLMATKGVPGFPQFIAAGRTHLYRYCIMQLVGPDLGRLRRTRPDRKFSVSTALQILDQTLKRLEDMHDRGWLNRDVKAPNFAIGVGADERTVYMLDFGFARKFKDADGKIIPPRSAAALMGTFQYCAVSAHSHKDQCAKDDLESWFYMAVELLKGPLPWASIDGHKNHKLIGEQKMLIRSEPKRSEFFEDVPKQFIKILELIDNTGFFDRPDYAKIRQIIYDVAKEKHITMQEPMDWENNKRMQMKANFVGELGESHQASSRLDQKEGNTNDTMDIEFELADETHLDKEETPRENDKTSSKEAKHVEKGSANTNNEATPPL
ncbi:unnamed protein product [Caenorhabditis bovis]|uniref:Protein kinase domain-containing protein n=1 Tax=Caenorhabditis bovis TaxID=2654633 RepID=A0A8S1EM16_9PELO|nr:unnamed protein product [Caenorhabditis bovis]